MSKNDLTKKSKKIPLIVAFSMLMVLLIVLFLYLLVFKDSKSNTNPAVVEVNKQNAESIEAEKNQDTVIITNETLPDTPQPSPEQPPQSNGGPQATVDEYGPSTKLDRPNVHAVVLATYSIYADFLSKLKSVPESGRQGVADQYVADNSAYFSPSFNYSYAGNLHLFPQSSSVALPDSIRVYSAIVDPSDPSQVIVQIFMEPDASWSILAVVKMKDSLGNFGTFEKLIPRMNRNPL